MILVAFPYHWKGDSCSTCRCFAQQEATLRLVDLALCLILQGLCLLCPHPTKGSVGPAVWAAASSSIFINCGCAIFFHPTPHLNRSSTRGSQDNPGRWEGHVWRPPFADEEIEGDDVVKELVQGYTE